MLCTFCGKPDCGDIADVGWDRHGSVGESDERMCLACRTLASLRTGVLLGNSLAPERESCDRCERVGLIPEKEIPDNWRPGDCWTERAQQAAGVTGRRILWALQTALNTTRWDSEGEAIFDLFETRHAWYIACAELEQQDGS